MILASLLCLCSSILATTLWEANKDRLLQFVIEESQKNFLPEFDEAVKNFVEGEDNETELPLLLAAIDADTQLSVIKDCGEELVLATEDLQKSIDFLQAQSQFIELFISTENSGSSYGNTEIDHYKLSQRVQFFIWEASKNIDKINTRSLSQAFQNLLFLGAPPAHLALVLRAVLGSLKRPDIELMKQESSYGPLFEAWEKLEFTFNSREQFMGLYGYEDNVENSRIISKYLSYVGLRVRKIPELLSAHQNFIISGSPVQDLAYFLRALFPLKPVLSQEVKIKFEDSKGDQVTQNWLKLTSISQKDAREFLIDLYSSVKENNVMQNTIRGRIRKIISKDSNVNESFLTAYKNYYREKLSVDDPLLLLSVFGDSIQRNEIIAYFYTSGAFGRSIKGWLNLLPHMTQSQAQDIFLKKYLNVLPLPKKYIGLDFKIEDSDLKNAIELYDQSGNGFEDPWLAVKCLVNLASYND